MAKINDMQTTIQAKQLTPVVRLQQLLSRVDIKEKFDNILKDKAPSFISSIISLYNSNQQLQAADPMSIISAAAIAATLDLPVNPQLGFAHIVPYGSTATFQIGWKGFVQLAIRTAAYQTMNAAVIYEGELISYNRISGETIIDESKKKSDKVIGYVAYFNLKSGFEKYLYMTTEQVTAHARKFSKSFGKPSSPWTTNFDAMALKTVLRLLLSKYGILSVDIQKALQFDQSAVRETIEGPKPEYIDSNQVKDESDSLVPAPVVSSDIPNDAQEPA